MLAVEEALKLVEQHALALAPRRVALEEAAGLVLTEEVVSAVNSPPYDKTLMDGYAVVSSDRSEVRTVLEEVGAGSVPRRPVTLSNATRLMTGAPLPEGADAVIPFEESELDGDDRVRFLRTDTKPGQHMLSMGAALQIGQRVFEPGTRLRPIEIGILAEIGHAVVQVQPRPNVAVLPTGNELVAVNERPAAGQIRNSNGPMLAASITRDGGQVIELPVARDERTELHRLIQAGLDADILLLCGGVSAGKFDLVPEALAELGVVEVFHKVALRPGKPLWFGVKEMSDPDRAQRRVLIFGLPGNPVSSLVCYELFARPAIAALAGRGFATASLTTARLSHDFRYKGGRASCLPAAITASSSGESPSGADDDGLPVAEILPWQGSADLVTLARANALVLLGTEPMEFARGTTVTVRPL